MHLRLQLLFVFLCAFASVSYASTLRASAVKVDITPTSPQWLTGYGARQSDGVNDPLYHRVVALDDGKTTIYFASTDVCLISPGYFDKVAADIQQQLGIDPRSIWWSATHTHSAPEIGPPGVPAIFMPERYKQAAVGDSNQEYTKFAEAKLIEALRLARDKLQPARLGIGLGYSTANINRRAVDADGAISLGMNPDGPVDRQIGLIRLEDMKGTLIALIANYAIHGTAMGPGNLKISGDVPGVVEQYVEDKLGAPLLFLNGAEGDMAPIYSVYPDIKSAHLGEFRVMLGDRILQANQRITGMTSDVVLTESDEVVDTPFRSGLTWPSDLGKYMRTTPAGESFVRIPVKFLEINHDTILWGAPLEMFCEIAIDVRNRSRFQNTFYVGLLNGWLGYMPTSEAFSQKGYEPATSPFTPKAQGDLRDAVSAHLAGLSK